MICELCKSENVSIQTVSNVRSRGGHLPIWYYFLCIWAFDWIFFFVIAKILKRKADAIKTKLRQIATCQNCGYHWEVK